MLCDYGCGDESTYYNKRTKKYCCSKKANSCPAVRMQNSKRQLDPIYQQKRKNENLKKYGVEHHMLLNSMKEKVKNTTTERYGVGCVFKAKNIKIQIKKTNIKKYGTEFPQQTELIKKKIKKTFSEKYNGHPMFDNNVKEKIKKTFIERYGVDNPGKTEQSRKQASKPKSNDTRKKMSDAWHSMLPEDRQNVIEKTKKTNLERYGVEYIIALEKNRSSRSISTMEIKWLDSLKNDSIIRQYEIPKTNMVVDGYDPVTNTIFLFHGDFWHGNPAKFNQNETNPRCKKTYGELYENTLSYEKKLKNMGYTIIVIWENDFAKI